MKVCKSIGNLIHVERNGKCLFFSIIVLDSIQIYEMTVKCIQLHDTKNGSAFYFTNTSGAYSHIHAAKYKLKKKSHRYIQI